MAPFGAGLTDQRSLIDATGSDAYHPAGIPCFNTTLCFPIRPAANQCCQFSFPAAHRCARSTGKRSLGSTAAEEEGADRTGGDSWRLLHCASDAATNCCARGVVGNLFLPGVIANNSWWLASLDIPSLLRCPLKHR